jgi:uncharacterized protein (DUF433 family)
VAAEGRSPDRRRTSKSYPIWQAARLAKVSPQTARKWLLGYEGTYGHVAPLFGERARPDDKQVLMLSFIELVELAVAARFRKPPRPIKIDRIRDAHTYARKEYGIEYPFANVKLLEWGGHIVRHFPDLKDTGYDAVALDMGGQPTLPGLVTFELMHNLVFSKVDQFAELWYPRGRETPIVINPYVAAGRPTIDGTGVTIATVMARWNAGEKIGELAEDYDIPREKLEHVLQVANAAA